MSEENVVMEDVGMMDDPFDDVVEIEPVEEEVAEDDASTESKEDEGQEPEAEAESDEEEDGPEDSEPKAEPEAVDGESDEEAPVSLEDSLKDGSYELKIDDADVTIQELKNDYIGQKEISRRFTEYDVKSKKLDADTEEINEYINTFAGHLKNGDSVGAMQYFGEFAGVAPYMIKEQLIAALTPEVMRRQTLSPTEVQNEYLSNQNEYLVEKDRTDAELRATQETQRGLNNSINELRETNDISEDDWHDTMSHLEKTLDDGDQLTPELVKDTILYGRMYEQAELVVKASEEQLDNAEQWIEELVNVKEKYPDFTEDDLKEVLASALKTQNEESTESKLAKKVIERSPVKKQTKTTPDEELDPELEDWL